MNLFNLWTWAFTASPDKLLILGLGRLGQEVATEAQSVFPTVIGTTRNSDPNDKKTNQTSAEFFGAQSHPETVPCCLDAVIPVSLSCSHVLVTIPAQPHDANLENLFDKVVASLPDHAWIGVISTTSVYGDTQGSWVNEESPTDSDSPYVAYENAWQTRVSSVDSSHLLRIFRCAGIYGPGRSALHTVYRNGGFMTEKTTKKDVPTNRIHSSDIARATIASMLQADNDAPQSQAVRIFNLADDEPAPREQVFAYARNLFNKEKIILPTVDDVSDPTRRRRRRTVGSKRVSNERMKKELKEELLYPTFRQGLHALLVDRRNPWSTD